MIIDDNCRPHRANLDLTSFSRKESHDKWPTYSLDMNQIQYVLHNLGRLEVCTGPGLAGLADDRWLFQRAGPANEGWFFQRAGPGWDLRGDFSNGPGRAGTWGVIFRTSRAVPAKREMCFLTAESGYKKRKTNNITSQFGLRKQRRSFETDR